MSARVLQFFRQPVPDTKAREAPEAAQDRLAGRGKRSLVCRACGQDITSDDERISINGEHVHTRINPSGFAYTFCCFHRAPGCLPAGATSYEHTWFAGYSWQIVLCAGCGGHLGWHFLNQDGFYGLIEERLVWGELAGTG